MAIEEAVGEEEEICSTPSFKKSQSHTPYAHGELFTAATFDRKYCKRNRANRDSALTRRSSFESSKSRNADAHSSGNANDKSDTQLSIAKDATQLYDEDDDFNNLLMTNDYDMKSSLSGEILSYFDTKLNKSASLSQPEIDSHPSGTGTAGTGVHVPVRSQSDMANVRIDYGAYHEADGFCRLASVSAFNQNDILSSLVSESKDSDKSDVNSPDLNICTKSSDIHNVFANSNGNAIVPFLLDSDEGSITSGCETSSIITTAHMEDLMKSEREIDAITLSLARLPLKQTISNLERVSESEHSNQARDDENAAIHNEEDSEFSDESGFDENNSSKLSNFHKQSTSSASTMSNADANNNIKHTFSSNTTKTVGRLRINIPKNAKSIDI